MEFQEIDREFFREQLALWVRDEPKAFAYDVKISVSAVHNYLSGRKFPTTQILFRIAQYTRRPMEWFLSPVFAREYEDRQHQAA